MNNILYKVHNNIYVNLTNRCPCACTFCLRQTMDKVGESDSLWLKEEPDLETVKAAFENRDMSKYDEVVFCGFGEPTERIDLLLDTAKYIKETYRKPIRLNTNGLGNLINERDIVPEMKGLIDTVSISLNTPDKEDYLALVRPRFGEQSFEAMLAFAEECVGIIPNVVLSTVDTTITKEQEEQCAEICRKIGAKYRIRPWEG
ncbi:MAG: TIGR04100 family radical SAM protein [Lachnospiraceae bacterium]|nr:TIGR04100 family radical SAM protein [Lachnospiraceae bacterium]